MPWLGNKRHIRGQHIAHPLDNESVPFQMTDGELKEAVHRWCKLGDTDARHRIILGHIRLAINIASRYVSQAPYKKLDLASEAMVGLTYAVNRASEKLKDDSTPEVITLWITRCVHRFVYRFIVRDRSVNMPYTTFIKKSKKGEIIVMPQVQSIGKTPIVKRQSKTQLFEIKDVIDTIIKRESNPKIQELKRNIMQLVALGYNCTEIALTLNISRPYANRLKNQIARKLKKEL